MEIDVGLNIDVTYPSTHVIVDLRQPGTSESVMFRFIITVNIISQKYN